MRNTVMAAALAGLFAQAAPAQESCAHAGTIRTMAQHVLDHRAEAGGFAVRRAGGLAAYLLIHYAAMDDAAALDLLEGLATADTPLSSAPAMIAALLIRTAGPEAVMARGDISVSDLLLNTDPGPLRALIAHDDGATLARLWSGLAADDPAATIPPSPVIRALVDQDAARREAVARNLWAAGLHWPAAMVAVALPDLALLDAIVADPASPAWLRDEMQSRSVNATALLAAHLPGARFLDGAGEDDRAATKALFRILQADMASGPAAFLGIVVNQTGRLAEGEAAADALLSAIAADEIAPQRDPEPGWLKLADALRQTLGEGDAARALTGFDWPPPEVRHYSGPVDQSLAILRARAAFGPWLRGEVAVPGDPGPGVDAALWQRVGTMVRAGSLDPGALTDPAAMVAAIELLELAGDWDELRALVEGALEPRDRIAVYDDMMRRLDQLCDGVTVVYGMGLANGGAVVMDFADRGSAPL